ncbi:hypothetical protein OIV83_002984 [Microbotryomycetes sp. JL201]|nr:hypothetical protein OIV83_002984 [Microbotryomycetes sp. JL201]
MTDAVARTRTPRRRRQSVASPTATHAALATGGVGSAASRAEHPRSNADLRQVGIGHQKALEEWCDRSLARCSKHERDIDRLKHEIDGRMHHWDEMTANLKTSDDRARQLVSQMQTALRILRTSTTNQVSAAKSATLAAEQRVGRSRSTLEDVKQSIEHSSAQVDVLEQQLRDEELTQNKVDTTRNFIFWLSVVSIALVSCLVAFLLNRHEH